MACHTHLAYGDKARQQQLKNENESLPFASKPPTAHSFSRSVEGWVCWVPQEPGVDAFHPQRLLKADRYPFMLASLPMQVKPPLSLVTVSDWYTTVTGASYMSPNLKKCEGRGVGNEKGRGTKELSVGWRTDESTPCTRVARSGSPEPFPIRRDPEVNVDSHRRPATPSRKKHLRTTGEVNLPGISLFQS